MTADQIDIVRRALALRKQRKIGCLLAEGNGLWISCNEYEPWKDKVRISYESLKTLVEEAEETLKTPAAARDAKRAI